MNHVFFLSSVWLCGQGRTPPCADMSFADFLAKWNKKNTALLPPDNPVGSPPALLPQALKRTHGGPAKPYNTLHLFHKWCALAGGRRARRPRDVGSGNLCSSPGPRFCRHGGVQEGRRSPTYSCGVLPSLHP